MLIFNLTYTLGVSLYLPRADSQPLSGHSISIRNSSYESRPRSTEDIGYVNSMREMTFDCYPNNPGFYRK